MKLIQIETSKVKPNPFQPREKFDKEQLQELADNIKTHGLIEPIVITEKNMIVAGERRWRASKLAKLGTIWALQKSYAKDSDIKRDSLVENEMRENLSSEEFKTFCYSLAKSLGYKIDKELPMKLTGYIMGVPSRTAAVRPFYERLKNLLTIEYAPKKIQKFVEKGNLDIDTAARIERIEDKEAKEEVIKMVEEKAKAEPGVTSKITSTAIRNEITRKNQEQRSNQETERLKKSQAEEERKITEQNILNRIIIDFGNFKDDIHSGANKVYPLNNKSFMNKLSDKGRLSVMDTLKPIRRELDRALHIVTKAMKLYGGN